MKIVILGNGFDLASGLPTGYEHFFGHNEKKYRKELENINGLLDKKNSLIFKQNTNTTVTLELIRYIESEIMENIKKDFEPIREIVKKTKISIWSIYFWYAKELKFRNWSDVESQISNVIKNISILSYAEPSTKIVELENKIQENLYRYIESIKTRLTVKDSNLYVDNIYQNISREDKLRYICDLIARNRYENIRDIDYIGILKKELEYFEEDFKEYIKYISNTIIKQKKYRYRLNFLLVANEKDSNEENEVFLLNFNYTDFSGYKDKDIEHTEMSHEKIKTYVTQVNVHGTYHSKVLFGIDQSNNISKELYQFTKTYRKIEAADSIQNIKLPDPCKIDEIIIFGHSLSEADYSYFHSIFDYYNIYDSNIKLIFKYGNHGEPSLCKSGHVQKVMELLKIYGNKMIDRAKGENLVHKLLLENRLSISNVYVKQLIAK